MAEDPKPVRRRLVETRALVAATAARLFEANDLSKVSMSEIAEVAGVSRQAAYRAFANRADLLRHILNDRLKIIGASLTEKFERAADLEEALVECAFAAVQAGRHDPLFTKILRGNADHSVDQFIFQGSPEINAITQELWGPHLEKARKKGLVDPNISDERFLDWIQQVEAVLSMREDFSEEEQRRLLHDFLVPSIIRRPPAGDPPHRRPRRRSKDV